MRYDFKKTLGKGLRSIIYFGTPALLAIAFDANPSLSSITLGTLVTMLSNYLKHKGGNK